MPSRTLLESQYDSLGDWYNENLAPGVEKGITAVGEFMEGPYREDRMGVANEIHKAYSRFIGPKETVRWIGEKPQIFRKGKWVDGPSIDTVLKGGSAVPKSSMAGMKSGNKNQNALMEQVEGMKPAGGRPMPAAPPPPPPEAGGEGNALEAGSPGMLPAGGEAMPSGEGGPGPWKGHEWAQMLIQKAPAAVRSDVMKKVAEIMKLLSTPGNTEPGPGSAGTTP